MCLEGSGHQPLASAQWLQVCLYLSYIWHPSKISSIQGLPGGPVVKNLPSDAEDMGSTLGLGTKIPGASEDLSPCITAREL